MTAALLELDRVDAFYGSAHILHQLSLAVGGGERVALVGRNGVGKTTVVNTILGLASLRGGTIRLGPRELPRPRAYPLRGWSDARIVAALRAAGFARDEGRVQVLEEDEVRRTREFQECRLRLVLHRGEHDEGEGDEEEDSGHDDRDAAADDSAECTYVLHQLSSPRLSHQVSGTMMIVTRPKSTTLPAVDRP